MRETEIIPRRNFSYPWPCICVIRFAKDRAIFVLQKKGGEGHYCPRRISSLRCHHNDPQIALGSQCHISASRTQPFPLSQGRCEGETEGEEKKTIPSHTFVSEKARLIYTGTCMCTGTYDGNKTRVSERVDWSRGPSRNTRLLFPPFSSGRKAMGACPS